MFFYLLSVIHLWRTLIFLLYRQKKPYLMRVYKISAISWKWKAWQLGKIFSLNFSRGLYNSWGEGTTTRKTKSFRLIFLEGSIILAGKVQQQEKQHNHFIKLIGPNLYNTNILGTPKENLTGDSNPWPLHFRDMRNVQSNHLMWLDFILQNKKWIGYLENQRLWFIYV